MIANQNVLKKIVVASDRGLLRSTEKAEENDRESLIIHTSRFRYDISSSIFKPTP
jgi:hypothetical protein